MNQEDNLISKIVRHRIFFGALMTELLIGVIFVAFALWQVNAADTVAWSRYSYFGPTHYYRDRWYYFYAWPIFGLIVTGLHGALAIQSFRRGNRKLALAMLLASIVILVVAFVVLRYVTALPR